MLSKWINSTAGVRIIPIITILLVAVLWGFVSDYLPSQLIIVGIGGLIFIIFWLWLISIGKDFEGLFLLLVVIGFFQDFIGRLMGWGLPPLLWGAIKYCLLLLMAFDCLLRVPRKRFRVNRNFAAWFTVWLLLWPMLGIYMVEARQASGQYSPITTIQIFGIGNMLLGIIVYFEVNQPRLIKGLKLLTYLGVIAALFGVVQRLIGPERLALIGLMPGGGGLSDFLSSINPETNFLDLEYGFRSFSFFYSHHAFSSFLILSAASLQILKSQNKINIRKYLIFLTIIIAGFLVTFNLTNLLTLAIFFIFFGIFEKHAQVRSILRVFSSRKTVRLLSSLFILSLALVAAISPLRSRLVSVFDIRKGAAGAGGSLAYRLEAYRAGILAVVEYPLGIGLALGGTQENLGYARINNFFTDRNLFFSGDNWFQWLMVQVGLPVFILYAALFVIPIVTGLYLRKRIHDHNLRVYLHGCLALVISVFIAGVSNSPTLAFSPSNYLIWVAVGIIFLIPKWITNQNGYPQRNMREDRY